MHSKGLSLMPDHPLGLIFGDPEAAAEHHYSLADIPIGGGWTVSIVAVLMALCLLIVLASKIYLVTASWHASLHLVAPRHAMPRGHALP